MKKIVKDRNIGLDLLRIVSMLMIVTLHILGKGGALSTTVSDTWNLAWILELFSIVAVNLYVLISGYFLIDSNFKFTKLIKLWKKVWFYSIIMLVFFILCKQSITTKDIIYSIFPILTRVYWFATTYFFLYIISPYLNKLIRAINQKEHFTLCLLIVVIFSVLQIILPYECLIDNSNGYGIIWFICLYIFASYIRLYLNNLKFKKSWLFYLISLVVLVSITIGSELLLKFLGLSPTLNDRFFTYNSIFVLIPSLLLFIGFKNIKINNKCFSKIINLVSPLTFGVYLIHDNFLVARILYQGVFRSINYTNNGLTYFLLYIFLCVSIIFIVCCIIEFVVNKILNVIVNDNVTNRIDRFVNKVYLKICNFSIK